MNTNMNGKLIALIDLDPIWTQHGNPERLVSGVDGQFALSATHFFATDERALEDIREQAALQVSS